MEGVEAGNWGHDGTEHMRLPMGCSGLFIAGSGRCYIAGRLLSSFLIWRYIALHARSVVRRLSSSPLMCLQAPSPLLGLPTELRLQIYEAVVDLPVDCQVARRNRNKPPVQAAPALPIPWLSLMLVCKTITEELRHLHTSTYELELDNLDKRYRRRRIADEVTWRRISCPPSRVRTLQANLVLHIGTKFWGCGGPCAILSELYQVLNCFIHNGPSLIRATPLVNHIHLSTLIIEVSLKDPDPDPEPYDYDVDEVKKDQRYDLERYISQVVDRGLLFGAVGKIVCRWAEGELDADSEVTEWEVSFKEIGDMTEWEQYDFGWGVSGSSSLAASQSDVDGGTKLSQAHTSIPDLLAGGM
ncbi:hypothetical protein C8R45DRAFT_262011 [Mycena sanguinolenta]|nr:hypothetical protein C8R45DRAFT_262011 [Mycena sanguinolenta]